MEQSKMSFLREENLGEQLIRMTAERGRQDPIFEKVAGRHLPDGILSPGIREQPGGEVEYCYRVSGLLPLAESQQSIRLSVGAAETPHAISRGQFTGSRIMEIMVQITDTMQELQEYLIDPEYLSLSTEEIFLDEEGGRVRLLYRPQKEDSLLPQVRELMNFFLQQLIHDNTADMQRIYLLYSELQKDNRSIIEAVQDIRSRSITVMREKNDDDSRSVRYENHTLDSAGYSETSFYGQREAETPQSYDPAGGRRTGTFGWNERHPGEKEKASTGKEKVSSGKGTTEREKMSTGKEKGPTGKKRMATGKEKGLFGFRKKRKEPTAAAADQPGRLTSRPVYSGEETVCLSDLDGSASGSQVPQIRLIPSDPGGIPMRIDSFPAVIGKDRELRFRIAEPTVSRRHAVIERRGERYLVKDLGSTNGTFVNESRIRGEGAIRDGDLIRFADMEYRIEIR